MNEGVSGPPAGGVNRISLGVQSAHDCELNCLHRPIRFQQAQRAVARGPKAKIKNISLDRSGLPNQDMAGWRDTAWSRCWKGWSRSTWCYGLKVSQALPGRPGGAGRSCPTTTSRRICIFGQ